MLTYKKSSLLLPVLAVLFTSISYSKELPENGSFKKTVKNDNLWDGIDKDSNVRVPFRLQRILVDGNASKDKQFGASPCWADVTGDKKPELIVTDANGFVWIFPVVSKPGEFPPRVLNGKFLPAYFGYAATCDVVDYNNDGLNDILIGTAEGAIQILLNRGNGEFLPHGKVPSYLNVDVKKLRTRKQVDTSAAFPLIMKGSKPLCIGNYVCPRFVDWDKDGKKDLIIGDGSYSANSVYFFKNHGSSTKSDFNKSKRQWLGYGMGREHLTPTVGDLDGDGDNDLLVGSRTGELFFYENTPGVAEKGAPYLTKLHEEPVKIGDKTVPAGEFIRPYLIDLDKDGDLDLLLGTGDGRVLVSKNDGTKGKPSFQKPLPLKGKDVMPIRNVPAGRWRAYLMDYKGGNSGVKIEVKKDEKGKPFTRIDFAGGYIGVGGGMITFPKVPVTYNKPYNISFRARGDKTSATCSLRQGGETKVKGDTKEILHDNKTFKFKVTPEWQNYSFNFKPQRLTKQRKGNKTIIDEIQITLNKPAPSAYLDITDVRITPAGE